VFTARYGLIPYMKQITFRLLKVKSATEPRTWLQFLRHTKHTASLLGASWNVMAYAQKPDFVFRRNWPVYLNRRGRQFIRLLAVEVCASAVVMLDTPCSEVVWRVLATHYIRQFPLHFPNRASPCAITFQLESTAIDWGSLKKLLMLFPEYVQYCVGVLKSFSYLHFALTGWKQCFDLELELLTLILLMWRIVANIVSRWQMGFNWAFKGLKRKIFLLTP
jgi:hypothetical protein